MTHHELFILISITTMKRIYRDLRKLPEDLQPCMDYLRNHLYDRGFDVQTLKRACGINSHRELAPIQDVVGMTLKHYIQKMRLDTAKLLLQETELRLWQISDCLGYSSIDVFSKAFERHIGVRPIRYRKQRQANSVRTLVDASLIHRGLHKALSCDQVVFLLQQLRAHYPTASYQPESWPPSLHEPGPGKGCPNAVPHH